MLNFDFNDMAILVRLNGHHIKIINNKMIFIFDARGNMSETICLNKNGEITSFNSLNESYIWFDSYENEFPDISKIKILRYVGEFIGWKFPPFQEG